MPNTPLENWLQGKSNPQEPVSPDLDNEESEHIESTATFDKPKVINDKPKSFSMKNMFMHHDSHPLVLDVFLMDKYGFDWFTWEPETIWRSITLDFKTPSISDHVKSKIQATKTIHISDKSFTKWEIFCVVSQALNNNIPDFEVMRKPTISQLFATVDMMMSIRNDTSFSDEVSRWCAASLLDVGVECAPQPLEFCQDALDEIQKFRKVESLGKQVHEKYKHYLPTPIEEVMLGENNVDVQVAKLLIARDYMNMRRQQMVDQFRVLR